MSHDDTARAVFGALNELAERHRDDDQLVVLAAVMAWTAMTGSGASDETIDTVEALAHAIADLAQPLESMN